MSTLATTRAFTSPALIVLLLILVGVVISEKYGYGQNAGQVIQSAACQQFQQTVAADISGGGSIGTIKINPHSTATIEQVALRIDAINYVVPAVASLTTSVRSVRSAYYLPIPPTQGTVIPARPLTLMEHVQLYADSGTDITLSLSIDGRYPDGTGHAEWSISGLSCGS